jgi:hypothetical protein
MKIIAKIVTGDSGWADVPDTMSGLPSDLVRLDPPTGRRDKDAGVKSSPVTRVENDKRGEADESPIRGRYQ